MAILETIEMCANKLLKQYRNTLNHISAGKQINKTKYNY